nr:antitoxin Xre-like helix-turn-helix domain-containing protein [Pseudomonas putida]
MRHGPERHRRQKRRFSVAISSELTHDQQAVGLKTALRVLEEWNATHGQVCSILRISPSSRNRIAHHPDAVLRLDADQLQRVSLVLNIHAALRNTFDNQANVKGFPSMKNDNDFFQGRSPLEVMSKGSLITLYETYKRLDHLHWGG